ncbi:Transcription and mRNA export factor SUS1 [Candida viswanathii]|uniref:Transcription and mRNA export factor SUS1 n=1 Tax=Candida viswanathii TaxID=5486 RepID=A0A367XW44_9ASCO|nr:Transcription and mRNA export factor SUS1 [Candida viswanathii]
MSNSQRDELDQIKAKIQDHLISSGNYDIINQQLKLKLYEAGWYDKIAQIASTELNDQHENHNKDLTFDQLFTFIKPKAENLVPNEVKQEILEKIVDYLDDTLQ